ncbi:hypothetical protein [Sulfobacillus thermosulfidooxidans]|uniref:hypothetical protein n=1 Tax=Sulfobacillus thermosulfidooxidans TaxID=28034 RepID=UPI00096B6E49|nr:hypothetical protein [Sulfobacillus thermosulfidooxidans]OLZ09063.1 hypothetical protein BFX05_02355 [Sulfobacillus thermosulfidooxidans]OLZ15183.1 hypothetical protein BFX06_04390 [Sulfobacillus thermosulfidooxidans]OLZ22172.1 hypothetical protein BFX07_09910 [Sulfobacillus thermosulfidooxidans]
MKWVFDSEEAQWLTTGLRDFWDRRLVSVAPQEFAAYGRLFHPAYDQEGHALRWADVARMNGTVFTPRSDFLHLGSANGAGRWIGEAPMPGSMDESTIRPLIRILRYFTETPDQIYYALWDGLGWDNARILSMGQTGARATDPISKSVREGPRISIPGRRYLM